MMVVVWTIFVVLMCVVIAHRLVSAYDKHYRDAAEKADQVWWGDWTGKSFKQWEARHPPAPPRPIPNPRYKRLKQNGGSHTQAEWEALVIRYKHKCLCCKQKKPLTKDHVIPVAKGGTDLIDNLQPLCRHCNSRKGAKTIDYRP